MKFDFLEHTADIKFRAFGKNLEEVFINSALALKQTIVHETKIKNKIKKDFVVEAKGNRRLLYNFLEEFLFLLDSEDFIFNKVKVKIQDKKLTAEVWGDYASNYEFSNDVKAITYNDMFVKEENGKWIAQVVLDV